MANNHVLDIARYETVVGVAMAVRKDDNEKG